MYHNPVANVTNIFSSTSNYVLSDHGNCNLLVPFTLFCRDNARELFYLKVLKMGQLGFYRLIHFVWRHVLFVFFRISLPKSSTRMLNRVPCSFFQNAVTSPCIFGRQAKFQGAGSAVLVD